MDQLGTGKLHNDTAVSVRNKEGIVLFSRDVCHRLEPVSKMRHTFFYSPVFHGRGYDFGVLL